MHFKIEIIVPMQIAARTDIERKYITYENPSIRIKSLPAETALTATE